MWLRLVMAVQRLAHGPTELVPLGLVRAGGAPRQGEVLCLLEGNPREGRERLSNGTSYRVEQVVWPVFRPECPSSVDPVARNALEELTVYVSPLDEHKARVAYPMGRIPGY